MKLNKLQAEVGRFKRIPNLCFFDFAFLKEKVVGSYENDYIGHYRRNGVLDFRVMVDNFKEYYIRRDKYELWHFYDD
jgi:hypothetical protein